MAEKENYYIRINHQQLVEVTEEVYRAYYQEERRGRTIEEKDRRYGLTSYDRLDTVELTGQEMIPDRGSVSVEEAAFASIMCGRLHRCLALLDEPDQRLIQAIYFEGLSERKFAAEAGLHYMTVHNRKVHLLRQLKKIMEK